MGSVEHFEMLDLLKYLQKKKCYPGVYYRGGGIWRAHINCAGSCWEDAKSPLVALRKAFKLWDKNGRPMDGMAADRKF